MKDEDLVKVVLAYEADAKSYSGGDTVLQQNRAKLINYYNMQKYGEEESGLSKVVTSEVYEVVEGMIPQLMRLLMQNRDIGKFTSDSQQYDVEANQRTKHANYVFRQQHNATLLINSMLKDGLLLYTGWLKVYQDLTKKPHFTAFHGMTEEEYYVAEADLKRNEKITDLEQDEEGFYSFKLESMRESNQQKIEIIPPDDCLIGKGARSFEDAEFIGERTYKTKSDLISMGFEKKKLDKISSGEANDNIVDTARNHNLNGNDDNRDMSLLDKSKKGFWLGEYYLTVDMDGDGIAEWWQVFIVNNTILSKNRVDEHPYCVFVPIPLPHRAIGTCPAEKVAELQYWKSSLSRQFNNNIFINNFNRTVINELINPDDYLTPRPGGMVRSEGMGPVQNNIMPLPIIQQSPAIMEGINYVDTLVERVSGVTAYNQGMDTESLNKTATGFVGIKDMSMMRIEVIARQAANTLAQVFKKISNLAMRYQNEEVQIRVHGETLNFNPVKQWKDRDAHCDVDVGLGAGERQEQIANLNNVLQLLQYFKETGSLLADDLKFFNVLKNMTQLIGLKDTEQYFNNPEKPEQLLLAENEQLKLQLQQLQMQMQNPLAEAEQAKGQLRLVEQQQKQTHEMNMKMAEMEQSDTQFNKKLVFDLTKLEVDSKQNIPGSTV